MAASEVLPPQGKGRKRAPTPARARQLTPQLAGQVQALYKQMTRVQAPRPPRTMSAATTHGGTLIKMGDRSDLIHQMSIKSDANSVAVLTMLPEKGAFHYTDTYTAAPMALARPFSVSSFTFTPPGAYALDCPYPAGQTLVVLRRSALQMTIRHLRNDGAAGWAQWGRRFDETGAVTAYQVITSGGNVPLDFTHHMAASGNSALVAPNTWHPTHADAGVGEFRTLFVSATSTRPSTLSLARYAAAPLDWELRVYYLVGTEWTTHSTPTFPAALTTLSFTVEESGYYALELVMPLFAIGETYNTTVNVSGTSDVWRIEPMPGFDDHYATVYGVRINAASMLISPDCPASERSGRVTATQLTEGMNWYSISSPDSLGSLSDSESRSFTKGAYGYLKPSSDVSYKLRNVVHHDMAGRVTSVHESLTDGVDTIAFDVTVPESSAGLGYPASTVHLTTVAGCEYATSSVWVESNPPTMSTAEFARALTAIRDMPQFFENETHGEMIMRYLRAGARGVRKYGPRVLEVATLIAALLL